MNYEDQINKSDIPHTAIEGDIEDIKTLSQKVKEFFVKLPEKLKNTQASGKNKKIIILLAVLLFLVVLLLLGTFFVSPGGDKLDTGEKDTGSEVAPTSSATPKVQDEYTGAYDKLLEMREDFNSYDIQQRKLLPPALDYEL